MDCCSTHFHKLIISFVWAAIIFLTLPVKAQSLSEAYILSPQNRLNFGNYLFCEKDYLRAVHEFQEFLKFSNNDTARFKFAYSLAAIGRSSEALDNYKGLFFSSTLSEDARLEFYKVNFLTKPIDSFREMCAMPGYLPEYHKLEIERLKLFTHLLDNSYLPDSAEFINTFPEENREEINSLYLRKRDPEFKSPTNAAVFSAIIPGAGKIYTGDYADGITAFLATGILSYIAYDNFNANHKLRGALFAGLAVMTYAGNIYGSAASAQIYNAGVQFNFESDVKVFLNNKNYFIPPHDYLCQ